MERFKVYETLSRKSTKRELDSFYQGDVEKRKTTYLKKSQNIEVISLRLKEIQHSSAE